MTELQNLHLQSFTSIIILEHHSGRIVETMKTEFRRRISPGASSSRLRIAERGRPGEIYLGDGRNRKVGEEDSSGEWGARWKGERMDRSYTFVSAL